MTCKLLIATALVAATLLQPVAACAHDYLDNLPAEMGFTGCVLGQRFWLNMHGLEGVPRC